MLKRLGSIGLIHNTGPIQEIQQETEVLGKENHHVFYYIVI